MLRKIMKEQQIKTVNEELSSPFRYQGYKIEVVQDKDNEQEFSLEISWDSDKMTEHND